MVQKVVRDFVFGAALDEFFADGPDLFSFSFQLLM